MPRGVYDRKPKGEKAATPAPAKKAPAVKTVAKQPAKATVVAKPEPRVKDVVAVRSASDALAAFNILQTNLVTLAGSFKSLENVVGDFGLAKEIKETIETMAALRRDVFSDLLATDAPVVVTAPMVEAEEPPVILPTALPTLVLPQAPPPVVASPTLPQGNSNYTPPAPPAIPHH